MTKRKNPNCGKTKNSNCDKTKITTKIKNSNNKKKYSKAPMVVKLKL